MELMHLESAGDEKARQEHEHIVVPVVRGRRFRIENAKKGK